MNRLDRAFEAFHAENGHVYDELVKFARQLKARGHKHGSINMLFEVVRWHSFLQTNDPTYRLNNNLRSRYSRLIMKTEADLAGFFDVRELTAFDPDTYAQEQTP